MALAPWSDCGPGKRIDPATTNLGRLAELLAEDASRSARLRGDPGDVVTASQQTRRPKRVHGR